MHHPYEKYAQNSLPFGINLRELNTPNDECSMQMKLMIIFKHNL